MTTKQLLIWKTTHKQPPKVKSTPKPPPVNNTVDDTVKNVYKKSKVTGGGFRKTDRMSSIYPKPKAPGLGKKLLKYSKKALLGTTGKGKLVRAGLAVAGYYGAKAYLNRRGDLKSSDIRQTTKISDPSGKPIRFQYGDRKNPASYKLSKVFSSICFLCMKKSLACSKPIASILSICSCDDFKTNLYIKTTPLS